MSNLAYISRLVERSIYLVEQLKTNKSYEKFQSAYQQFHSTQTLFRVQNDLLHT